MKRQRKNGGFTLVEMLCALLILVLLVMGIGVGMDAGSRIYRDAIFESESATLAGILNTSLGDVLRYSISVREVTAEEIQEQGDSVGIPLSTDSSKRYVLTNLDYGIQDAYFYTPPHESGVNMGVLQIKNLRNNKTVELINAGAYPDLLISDFEIIYHERLRPGIEGGFFEVSYVIHSESQPEKTREVETIVRLMND